LLGLASFGLVLLRLVETWRVSPQRVSHQVAILGQTLSYPAANTAAVIVLILAALGAVVTARAVLGAAKEVTAREGCIDDWRQPPVGIWAMRS